MNEYEEEYEKLMDEGKYEEARNALSQAKTHFWSVEHPAMTREEKVIYWAHTLHQEMRWNGEWGKSELDVFSKEDYEVWKTQEPLLDALFPDIIEKLNATEAEVYERIGK
ncbi:MAG: hypothetical protein ACI85I_002067 [Arenicella sp.]|jgi:hypothetical protein